MEVGTAILLIYLAFGIVAFLKVQHLPEVKSFNFVYKFIFFIITIMIGPVILGLRLFNNSHKIK